MTLLRKSKWISTFLVAVIAFAWGIASNHCALVALEGIRKAPHACCRESGQSEPQPARTMQCCNTFHVTVPDHVAAPAVQLHAIRPAWLETSVAAFVALEQACEEFHTTGPPRVLGFAETVLNRSLLSHAPPHFVA